jgi:RHH-type proline utilization regulon transcriptional repressor/proline dehydrogenase/delta 1-pyrroline-5-carboxylate dehydrogenase
MTDTIPPTELEERVTKIGKSIFSAMNEGSRRGLAVPAWGGRAIQRRVLTRASQDSHFKTQLFRFVDVYPNLRDSGDLVRHLRAYLADRGELPPPLDRMLGPNGERRLPSWAVARLTDRTMQRMAKTFIAGKDAKEALDELKRLRRQHTAFTVDILGETCLSDMEATDYANRYLEALQTLPPKLARWSADSFLDETPWGANPRVNISLKISSLYSRTDPADFEGSRHALFTALRPLFLKAKEQGVFMNLDLERFAHRDLTYAVFSDLALDPELADYPHIGIVVQAYLRDSEHDLQNLVALAKRRETPITVRLVKGAYWDYENIAAGQQHWPLPVFSKKAQTDANFEHLTQVLIENADNTRPAIGTHNIRSMAFALAAAEAAGLAPRALELQVLHGMADPIRKAAVAQRYLVREYVPVGQLIPGMAYLVRRLLENTANESILRLTFNKATDEEDLLKPPSVEPPKNDAPSEPAASGLKPFVNEPHADFSLAPNREAMRKALATMSASLGRDYSLVINGFNVQTGATITSVNPARPDEVIGRVAAAHQEQADQAIKVAEKTFPAWRDTADAERAAIILRAAAIMRERRFELSALEVLEAGKPWAEADGDVCEAIDFMEYYSREMIRLSEIRNLSDVPGEEDLFFEPRGVAAVIAPWNFPLGIPTGMVSAALVAGNTVVFKPAGPTPVLGYALVRILHEAGVPVGALHFLPGSGEEVGDYLAGDPRVDMIAFTGSLEVGLSIMNQAAKASPGQRNVKRVVAEMGGKNAIIVDTDADLDAAVEGVIRSAFGYSGQKCSACSRVIVLESIHDQFVRRLTQAAASLAIGDPSDPAVQVGPVITKDARRQILAYIEKGKEEASLAHPLDADRVMVRLASPEVSPSAGDQVEGHLETPAEPSHHATAEIGETPSVLLPESSGYYVAPHVFVDTPPSATIAQEEIFGPVLAVIKARKFKEALELAQGVKYGLTGGLYSRNPDHIRRAKREFRVGNLYINRPITGAMVGRQPFGGSRMSGVGSKAGGPDYLLQFMEPRTVTENTVRRGFTPEE